MSLLSFLSDFLAGSPVPYPGAAASQNPRIGAIYHDIVADGPVGYARVIGLHTDKGGIRHIRFELMLSYRDKIVQVGERTLAAAIFSRRFPEWLDTSAEDADDAENADDGRDGEAARDDAEEPAAPARPRVRR